MMKKVLRVLLIPVVVIAVAGGLLFAFLEMSKEREREASAEAPVIAPSRVEHDTNGGPVLKLDEATEKLLGLPKLEADSEGVYITELDRPGVFWFKR